MAKGFTLLELMISLLVLAIALAVGAPLLSGYTQNQSIKNTAQLLNMDFNYAREQAVLRRANVVVTAAQDDWNKGWTIRDTTNNTLLKQRDDISSGVGLSVTPATGTSLSFNSQGWVSGTSITSISIDTSDTNASCIERRKRKISITAVGQITLTREACSVTSS